MVETAARTLQDLVEAVRSLSAVSLVGSDSGRAFRVPSSGSAASLKVGLSGIISHDVDDQVVTVYAGTPLEDLQRALKTTGQCLPWTDLFHPSEELPGTVGGRISLNLPHAYEADCGNWRDWVLGGKVVQADGTVAKIGSKAVKNVAGYDVQKLLVGARGTLAVLAEVTLRTYPLKALPRKDLEVFRNSERGLILRTQATDFERAVREAGSDLLATHPRTSTLYLAKESAPAYPYSWSVGWGLGSANLKFEDATAVHYMKRAKEMLDPTGKLNPGEMGIF
ncbi:MAG TPA: FAD-binding oxidoreductase [Fimbriimonas sp.]|nr:FAD-binding oxidoreductase [Fimbriimonas sp.]